MRKNWLLLIILGAALTGAVGTADWLYRRPQDRAMRAKFDEIRAGMTLEQVDALMGRRCDGQYPAGKGGPAKVVWNGPGNLTVGVFVDDQGVVVISKELHPTARDQMPLWIGLLGRIYRWLGV